MILYIWEVLYPSHHSLDPDVIFIVTTYMDSCSLSLFFFVIQDKFKTVSLYNWAPPVECCMHFLLCIYPGVHWAVVNHHIKYL